ncbi:MAG: TonB-dependent receptor [Novosphingobium sp.]
MRLRSYFLISTAAVGASFASAAWSQESPRAEGASQGIQEIIVTAQKRAQSASDVGLSITTVGGDLLARRRVDDPYEVAKLVPALSVSNVGNAATATYTLRGIGFNSASLGASPTVSIYVDEVPLAYPAMTQGAVLDLERIEVYKGPQGTLFGQNATAGAINFIAAKPTNDFAAGVSGTFGRFNQWNLAGFVSGPVADGVRVRLAASHDGGDGWQRSYTRDDTLGRRNRSAGRALLEADLSESVKVTLGLSGWRDRSDSQALQLVEVAPLNPAFVLPSVANYPLAPANPRAADWDPDLDLKFRTDFWQPSLRLEWELADNLTLTSLTSYSHYKTDSLLDNDGTTFQVGSTEYYGTIKAFAQELRLSGKAGKLNWTIGANYADDKVRNGIIQDVSDQSNTQNVAGFSLGLSPVFVRQDTMTKAVFGNAEFALTDTISVIGGVRYTAPRIRFAGCNLGTGTPALPDTPTSGVTQSIEGLFNVLYQAFSGNTGVNPVQPGGCVTLNALDGTFLPTDSQQTLKEDNTSWNVTINYKPNRDVLLYALISQGYKLGSFPNFGASSNAQYLPAKQEALRAYEAGFKLTLADRTLQLDGAAFYYDYTDKQLSGYLLDPIFGPLQALVNIPKSKVQGGEIQVAWAPLSGLNITAAATYIDTKIKRFVGVDAEGQTRDFAGLNFNLSPKWFGNLDANYTFGVSEGLEAMIGGGLTYRSSTSAAVGGGEAFFMRSYALVDLSVGIQQAGGEGWSARVWGKNITNEYYWNNVSRTADNIVRVAGMPATYGITVGRKF